MPCRPADEPGVVQPPARASRRAKSRLPFGVPEEGELLARVRRALEAVRLRRSPRPHATWGFAPARLGELPAAVPARWPSRRPPRPSRRSCAASIDGAARRLLAAMSRKACRRALVEGGVLGLETVGPLAFLVPPSTRPREPDLRRQVEDDGEVRRGLADDDPLELLQPLEARPGRGRPDRRGSNPRSGRRGRWIP